MFGRNKTPQPEPQDEGGLVSIEIGPIETVEEYEARTGKTLSD